MKKEIICPNCGSINTKHYYTKPKIVVSVSTDPRVNPKFDKWICICKDCEKEFEINYE